jgi:hypothetical protein
VHGRVLVVAGEGDHTKSTLADHPAVIVE